MQQFKKVRIKFFIIIILILFLGPIYYSIGVVVSDIFLFFLKRDILKIWNIPLVVLIITLLGLGLFYFRLYLRCIYGFTEAVIGVFIAIDKIDFPIDYDLTFLAILAGSLFLVVRGYDNMHQGYINEKDPVVKRIFEFFRQNGI